MKPFVIGITGCSGSGKTYFLNKLKERFPDLAVLSMDNHYKPIDQQVRDENNVVHFDLPESIDRDQFHQDLSNLVNGKSIEIIEYTFNVHGSEPNVLKIASSPVIIVEGIFTMFYDEVRDLLDYKIFVESTEEVMLARRIKRDESERGYHDESIRYRFENHVLPIYREHILPGKKLADRVVNNETDFTPDLEAVSELIQSKLV